jgi:hypothetical protein
VGSGSPQSEDFEQGSSTADDHRALHTLGKRSITELPLSLPYSPRVTPPPTPVPFK